MRALKVGEVNNYIKKILTTDMILSNIEVIGEISNYTHHYSGHRYFSLKDETGIIKCVMFKTYGDKVDIKLEEGSKISAKGYISVYEKTGEYQLYIREVNDQGLGDLYRKYEELKKKLEEEGLFDNSHKKEIPKMPKKIGIVTSATGAAVRDMVDVIHRRFPSCNLLIYPSLVQGSEAPKTLVNGIKYLDSRQDVDLIIIGRGGGSIDELFAFNDEELARTIFKCNTPIISAVGHETDFTISDFVADTRAATPSVAAEISVPDIADLKESLNSYERSLIKSINKVIDRSKSNMDILAKDLKYSNPIYKIQNRRMDLDYILKDLIVMIDQNINKKRMKLNEMDKSLIVLNPTLGLDKGYGILTDESGKLIKSIEDVNINDNITIDLSDGKIRTNVLRIQGGSDYGK